jgi:hypothetical protein
MTVKFEDNPKGGRVLSEVTAGFRPQPSNFAYPILEKDPQSVPGLFDAEIKLALDSANRFGQRVVGLALTAPASLVGWAFDNGRPWSKFL